MLLSFYRICICSNPLVPCDAITIPKMSLYPWKEGYHHHPYHTPVVVKAHASPALTVSPAPSFSPYHASPQPTQFAARQPKFSSYPTSYPTPGYHTPSKAQSPVKSFVHSPLTRYGVLGK